MTLFDLPPVSRNTDPDPSHVAEQYLNARGRRQTQLGQMLERLVEGPATNVELATISLKYTSRLSDLRAAGFVVECAQRQDGRNVYTLTGYQEPTP